MEPQKSSKTFGNELEQSLAKNFRMLPLNPTVTEQDSDDELDDLDGL